MPKQILLIFLLLLLFDKYQCEIVEKNCPITVKDFTCSTKTHDGGLSFVANCQWKDKGSWENFAYSLNYMVERIVRHRDFSRDDEIWDTEVTYLEEQVVYIKEKQVSNLDTKNSDKITFQLTGFPKSPNITCVKALDLTISVPFRYGSIWLSILIVTVVIGIVAVCVFCSVKRRRKNQAAKEQNPQQPKQQQQQPSETNLALLEMNQTQVAQ